eukprot:1159458-Pelagomonas_calceolata.AAC.2
MSILQSARLDDVIQHKASLSRKSERRYPGNGVVCLEHDMTVSQALKVGGKARCCSWSVSARVKHSMHTVHPRCSRLCPPCTVSLQLLAKHRILSAPMVVSPSPLEDQIRSCKGVEAWFSQNMQQQLGTEASGFQSNRLTASCSCNRWCSKVMLRAAAKNSSPDGTRSKAQWRAWL